MFGLVGQVGEGAERVLAEGGARVGFAGLFELGEGAQLFDDVGVGREGGEFGRGEVVELAEFGGGDGRVCELEGEAVGEGQVVAFEEVGHAGNCRRRPTACKG